MLLINKGVDVEVVYEKLINGIDVKFIDEIPDEIKSILVVANELSIEQHINTQSFPKLY